MGNALAIPCVASFTFRYSIFNRSQWKMLMQFPDQNPSSHIIKSLLKSMEHASGAPWTNSCTCLYKILIGTNGNYFKCFLIRNKWAVLLEPVGPIPLHFRIESVSKVHGKDSCTFLSQVPFFILIESQWNIEGKCSWSSLWK